MSDVLLDLPSHVRDRLVGALESGLLGPSPTLASLRSVLGDRVDSENLVTFLLELARLGISGPAAAAWIRTLERVTARTRKPDIVWSGPEVPGLHARDTRRVYEELMGSAERSIWASTYAFFDGPNLDYSRKWNAEQFFVRAGQRCDYPFTIINSVLPTKHLFDHHRP
jgi:hypothetical protein